MNKKYLLFSTIFLAISAAFLMWFLEYRYFLNDAASAWNFLGTYPFIFAFSALLILLALTLLTGLTRRPTIAVGILWSAIIIITYIHINKFAARGAPLLPEDFALASEAASLSKFINIAALIRLILAVGIVIALSILADRQITKHFQLKSARAAQKSTLHRFAIPSRLALIAISVLALVTLTNFARHHQGARYQDIPWLRSQFVAWNQTRNYDQTGFILGFLYNLQKLQITPPDNYSATEISKIHQHYDPIATTQNALRQNLADQDISLITIMNESFYDPEVSWRGQKLTDFYPHTGGEILPTLRRLQKQYPSGYMYSPDYGGGTANIEFEAFTGLTNYWLNTVPYTSLIPSADPIPSLASQLKSEGYRTTAIHPFNGTMYKRNIALRNLGFDTFITQLEMDYADHEGNSEYINDRSASRQLLDTLNSTNQNQLISLITMQNHLPYNSDIYPSTEFTSTANIDDNKKSELATYYQMLHNSDQYLSELIAALEKSDKKVALLYFGDHAAGLFDLVANHPNKSIRDLSRLTPYFLYTNYDTNLTKSALPVTTPNCLTNTLYNKLNLQKPTLHYLLDNICTQDPILTATYLDDQAPTSTPQLTQYQLLTYDLLSGRQYWLN